MRTTSPTTGPAHSTCEFGKSLPDTDTPRLFFFT